MNFYSANGRLPNSVRI
ncbi:MAG: hypothetical protein AB7D17_07310 [Methanobacteriales archaeon]